MVGGAQWVKLWWSKHEDLSVERRTHVKAGVMAVQDLRSLYWEGREERVLGLACQPAQLHL